MATMVTLLSDISNQLNGTADRLDSLFKALNQSLLAAGISQASSDISLGALVDTLLGVCNT